MKQLCGINLWRGLLSCKTMQLELKSASAFTEGRRSWWGSHCTKGMTLELGVLAADKKPMAHLQDGSQWRNPRSLLPLSF